MDSQLQMNVTKVWPRIVIVEPDPRGDSKTIFSNDEIILTKVTHNFIGCGPNFGPFAAKEAGTRTIFCVRQRSVNQPTYSPTRVRNSESAVTVVGLGVGSCI